MLLHKVSKMFSLFNVLLNCLFCVRESLFSTCLSFFVSEKRNFLRSFSYEIVFQIKGEELSQHEGKQRSVVYEFGLSTEAIGLETFSCLSRDKFSWKALRELVENWYRGER